MEFEDWLRLGYEAGFCGPPCCVSHDGVPMSEAEYEQEDEPCVHVLRLYADSATKTAVEADHAPSQWRASNRGLTH